MPVTANVQSGELKRPLRNSPRFVHEPRRNILLAERGDFGYTSQTSPVSRVLSQSFTVCSTSPVWQYATIRRWCLLSAARNNFFPSRVVSRPFIPGKRSSLGTSVRTTRSTGTWKVEGGTLALGTGAITAAVKQTRGRNVVQAVPEIDQQRVPARLPPRRFGFYPRPGHSGFSHVGIVPDDAVGRRVFSGISHFPHPFVTALSLLTSIIRIGSQDLDIRRGGGRNFNAHLEIEALAKHRQIQDGGWEFTLRGPPGLRSNYVAECFETRGFSTKLFTEVLRADEGKARCEWSSAGMRGREMGDHRENSQTSVIVRHDCHERKSGSDPTGDRTQPLVSTHNHSCFNYFHRKQRVIADEWRGMGCGSRGGFGEEGGGSEKKSRNNLIAVGVFISPTFHNAPIMFGWLTC
ncbi:hypothetical protein PR048_030871 [Dryococelus australis]|uniref:Uncharacterized protein n=1 Tax=Dryococelus australis TaxID=614101 RepID=A0ABQ9GAV3_9NEOP|nr:hypothetical protein PR048_030871 [Dryococelus australis]